MADIKLVYFVSVVFFCFVIFIGQSTSSDYPELQDDWSYCFEFTWFGPDYDNVTRYNGTCADYLDDTRADGIPCAAPIVISYDGTPPDIDWLWQHNRSSILCKRSRNQVCVRYTYYFNGAVNNATYMCARVQSLNSNSAITSGCYKQSSGAYETEVCVCKSTPGIYKPCNDASTCKLSSILFFLCFIYFIYNNFT
ncbi:hypothetical protein NQ318_012129 [Aromia moschata]|uniref:Uncharacterized protein n=1 Tax=Aromia moschata TaxID=1265417 RepID=A0AAV8YPP6_9CUCU|nr:hypothetical protein NQ318_012129 [Aromia moschata]